MTGLIGLVLAVAYLRLGRNLWVVILAHGLYDTVGLVMVYLGAALQSRSGGRIRMSRSRPVRAQAAEITSK